MQDVPTERRKRVGVIGAGLGGISAAISLAQKGYAVDVYEKNGQIGGKLNLLREQGYTFDLGPSILTLPHILERLFENSGRRMSDYIPIRTVRPHWRNFFEDGKVIDLSPDSKEMIAEAGKAGEQASRLKEFLDYSARLYDLINEGYFEEGLDSVGEIRRFYGLRRFPEFDILHSMHQSVARHLESPYLRDIFDFFIKYVGSSAFDAPAFMNCLPTIQFRYDLWYVDGGMYGIAKGLDRLMRELGVAVHLNSEVTQITKQGGKVKNLILNGGQPVEVDIVVSNLEVIPAYRRLLGESAEFLAKLEKFAPACSGLLLDLGLDRKYPQLAHHNFFFSGNQKEHFHSVFHKKEIPADPTIYLVAASRTDPTVAPDGCDCLKILPHIPPLDPNRPVEMSEYRALRDRLIAKLERMGLENLSRHIVFEHMWTPCDIERQYGSNGGSIYGVLCDRFRNFGFKAPKQSPLYPNLFFTGGSVNPGGGIPMVVLCGQNVARAVSEWDRSIA